MSKAIVCLGDSNTWGYDPRGFGGGRWPDCVRWTARLNARPEWIIYNLGEKMCIRDRCNTLGAAGCGGALGCFLDLR